MTSVDTEDGGGNAISTSLSSSGMVELTTPINSKLEAKVNFHQFTAHVHDITSSATNFDDANNNSNEVIPLRITKSTDEDDHDDEYENDTMNDDHLALLIPDFTSGTTEFTDDHKPRYPRFFQLTVILSSLLLIVLIFSANRDRRDNRTDDNRDGLNESVAFSLTTTNSGDDNDSTKMLVILRERFAKIDTRLMIEVSPDDSSFQLRSQQFVHLHHMKTGGTSIDTLIECGIDRLRQLKFTYEPPKGSTQTTSRNNFNTTLSGRLNIRHTTIHECSERHYETCSLPQYRKTKQQDQCISSVENAAILSYCAPLKDLYQYPFQWNQLVPKVNQHHRVVTQKLSTIPSQSIDTSPSVKNIVKRGSNVHHLNAAGDGATATDRLINAITILRHPVARVWSMYRFQTKSCYQCRSLLEIYQQIDNEAMKLKNDTTTINPKSISLPSIRAMCKSQLINHQTRNLLLSTTSSPSNPTEYSMALNYTTKQIQNAIYNMQHVFTMVGLTEDMNSTAQMVGRLFPWLAEDLVATLLNRNSGGDKNLMTNHTNKVNSRHMWDSVFSIRFTDTVTGINNDDDNDSNNSDDGILHVNIPDATTSGEKTEMLRKCSLQHENTSPLNNHCASNGRDHLSLPSVPPDDATIAAILAHNAADVELYTAAQQQFDYQKRILLGKV